MPGSIIHLAITERLRDIVKNINSSEDYYMKFRIGNLLPDLLKEKDKFYSHFWDKEMYRKMARAPIMNLFYEKYKIKSIRDLFGDPVLLGYFCHLIGDVEFIREYWNKNFTYYNEKLEIVDSFKDTAFFKVNGSNRIYNRYEFLSSKLYYGDYDVMWDDIRRRYNIEPLGEEYRNILKALDNFEVDIDKYDLYVCSNYYEKSEIEECRVLDINLIDEFIDNTSSKLSEIIEKELR